MPIFQGKKEIVVGSKISQAENDAFQQICEAEDRSMSYVLRELALRGLAQYSRDGNIKLTSDEEGFILLGSQKQAALVNGKKSAVNTTKQAKKVISNDEDMGLQFSGGRRKNSKQKEDELNALMDEAIDKVKKGKS